MGNVAEVASIFGFAMLPFIFSCIYGCSFCGDKKIFWAKDILALGLGFAVYFVAQRELAKCFISSYADVGLGDHWWVLFSTLAGFAILTVAMMIIYKILYIGADRPSAAAAH